MKREKLNFGSALTLLAIMTASLSFNSCGKDELITDQNEFETVYDEGIPDGEPGNASMYGYYSFVGLDGETWQNVISYGESSASVVHSEKILESHTYGRYGALKITDEKTIYMVNEEIVLGTSLPKTNIILESQSFAYQYKVGHLWVNYYTDYLYAYHSISTMPNLGKNSREWEGRYALNGNTMTVKTDLGTTYSMIYSNNEIEWNGNVYKNVKNINQ